ncbi:MAG: hypothetical protein ACLFS4_06775 [Opitutales bacterium]
MSDYIKRLRAAIAAAKIRDVGEPIITRLVKEAFDGQRNKSIAHFVGGDEAKFAPILSEIAPRPFASDSQISPIPDGKWDKRVRDFGRKLSRIGSTETDFSEFGHSGRSRSVLHLGQVTQKGVRS